MEGPHGTRMAIAVAKDTRGYEDFDPLKPGYGDIHNLQPDKLDSKLGAKDWGEALAQKGYTPENVIGYVDMTPLAKDPKTLGPGLVYVHPAFRRQGVAAALYDAIRAQLQPGGRIGTGMLRPDGRAFRQAYDARNGESAGEMARAGRLPAGRGEKYVENASTRHHIGRMRFEPITVDDSDVAGHVSAQLANPTPSNSSGARPAGLRTTPGSMSAASTFRPRTFRPC